ncbi:fibronectin type III domain-containing protein [Flavobacterium lindanitolerans]|uniref:fibronectin type III domain-containing protein n=1 Tax=Flavobacterium lindanitolerans TaxID=428988 RepID=UPI0031D9CAF4
MNKLKFLTAFVLIFTAFNFTSCDNEPLDSAIDPNPQPSCVAPTSFQASNFIGGTNVNLSWVASSEATSWEVQYGPTGFAIGEGTSVFSDVTNVTITGLVSTNTYHFYVRSNCSESEVSSWIGPISVGTSIGGGGTANRTLRMKIDGIDFVADNVVATKTVNINPVTNTPIINPETGQPEVMYSIAANANMKAITIVFIESNRTSYNIPGNGVNLGYIPNITNEEEAYHIIIDSDETLGNLTITANDAINRKISGTFNCKVFMVDPDTHEIIATKQITNGIFTNVTYTLQ